MIIIIIYNSRHYHYIKENFMIGVGERMPEFELISVKAGFNEPEVSGTSAFDTFSNTSFKGKWKVIYFYPKDFTFICPTEIIEFASINVRRRCSLQSHFNC